MKKKHIAIVVAIIVTWLGVIGFFILKSKQKEYKTNQSAKRYVIPEEKITFLNGSVQPKKLKVFYKDVTKGNNYKINKQNGENVSKGSLLITYKNEDISNQIQSLEEQIIDLKKEKNKTNNYKNQPYENQDSLGENIEVQIKNAQRELKKLKKDQYFYEYAPFAGKVFISNQDINSENQELLKLRSTDLYVKSQVSERDIEKVKEGQKVEVLILANNKKLSGKVQELSYEPEEQVVSVSNNTSQNSAVANYPVIIELDSQDDIVNGYHVQVKLKSSNEDIKIPTSAIKSEENKKYVYLIKDNKLVKQFINTKGTQDEFTIITSGLKEKDEIVEVINNDMKEGQEIE